MKKLILLAPTSARSGGQPAQAELRRDDAVRSRCLTSLPTGQIIKRNTDWSIGGFPLEVTKLADLKSAGQTAVQVLYKRSPECSKTPQNGQLQPLSHNNIRKTGSIRNRQVTVQVRSSAPFVSKPYGAPPAVERSNTQHVRQCVSLPPVGFGITEHQAIPNLVQVADLGAFLAAKYISKAPEGKISWKVYYEKLCSAKRVYAMVVADEYSLKRLHEMFVEIKKEEAEGRDPWDTI